MKPLKLQVYLVCILCLLASACASNASPVQSTLSTQAAAGKQTFDSICSACHSTLPETVIVGPSLSGIATMAAARVDGLSAEDYLRQSILDPGTYIVDGFQDVMPRTFGEIYGSEQLDALIAFLMTLK